jgi:hypothetical protein
LPSRSDSFAPAVPGKCTVCGENRRAGILSGLNRV